MKTRLQVVFALLVLVALGQALWQHAHLPATVATHFNGSGQANGWVSRGTHTALHLVTLLFISAVIQAIVWLNTRLPKELVNLPHRDYWLAPERAAQSHAWIGAWVLFLGCALLLFFIGLFDLVYRANFQTPSRLNNGVWIYAGGLLVATAVMLIALYGRFGRKPAA